MLISLVAVFAVCEQSVACWFPPFYWYMNKSPFRITESVYDDWPYNNSDDSVNNNIAEWLNMVDKNVDGWDIRKVVYDFTLNQLEDMLNKQAVSSNPIYRNTFVKYLRENKDSEMVDYLLLARRCEIARPKWFERSDKWWYPSKHDIKYGYDLQYILEEALAYNGTRLKDRYLLQAIRAAFTMKNYDLCFSLWKNKIGRLPNSVVKRMCAGYLGKILFQQGNYRDAIEYYAITNDYESFFWCAEKMIKNYSDIEAIKILYKYQPSSYRLAKMVQDVCHEAEDNANRKDFGEYRQYYIANRNRYIELRDFALQTATKNSNNNPAMWQYVAAFLTFLDGDAPLATQYLDDANGMKGTPFVKNSISNFMILANAHTAAQCDSLFESLLSELMKLEKVKSEPFEKYAENLFYSWTAGSISTPTYKNPSLWWYPSRLEDQYNFEKNEMTKITPAYLIPKYLALKDYTKVLLLAMSSNSWTVTESLSEYYSFYDTDIYFWPDVVPVENVVEFQELLNTGGRDEFERFLLARCCINNDFLNELIGTKYLREAQFEEAIPYLAKVSHHYIKNMNLYRYFRKNPFHERIFLKRRAFEKPYPAYKLNYAKRMLTLKEEIQNTRNAEKKASAMLQYAIALRRSLPSGEAWALTDYFLGVTCKFEYNDLRNVIKDEWHNTRLKESDKMLEQAEKLTKNPEIKAQCYLAKNYSYYTNNGYYDATLDNAKYLHLINNHAETQTVKQFMSECDTFHSYYKKHKTEYMHNAWGYMHSLSPFGGGRGR